MATIMIPTPLRKFAGNQSAITIAASRVDEAIQGLVQTHPELARHLLDPQQQVRTYVRLYVGDTDYHELQGNATPIDEKTVISIVPAIAGGIFDSSQILHDGHH